MSEERISKPAELCPTCGTRLTENASRCLVCGTAINQNKEQKGRRSRPVRGSSMPEITLSLPVALLFLAIFLGIGAVIVYLGLRSRPEVVVPPTPSPTSTITRTPTLSPTPEPPTPTHTQLPSPTPLSYEVKLGDTCAGIAFAFDVSIRSIVLLNNLPADCGILLEGQNLLIPQPTPTATALPSATLSPPELTEQACEKVTYTVQDNDTLSGIAGVYNIPISAIRDYNGLVSNAIQSGQALVIPLCRRNPTPGPTPTPTNPPPYAAPSLLLPADGSPFTLADDTIPLQWASVGTLRENESYQVSVENVTEGLIEGQKRELVEYVNDTKFIVPASFRPNVNTPHIFRWFVVTVRRVGTDDDGNPIYETAGAASTPRTFTWSGVSGNTTQTP